MTGEHPLAPYLRIVGKGPNLSRPLTRDEAHDAMRMILAGAADPLQVGGLLMLLRYRGETPEEIAGFVAAAREAAPPEYAGLAVDLDWPSYADRHQQQPWFVLSALLLAGSGMRVLMHGIDGAQQDHAPTRPVLRALGIAPAATAAEARQSLDRDGFAYVGLETLLPRLDEMFDLRDRLGVRTVVNTLARALNPAEAPAQVIGVAHPPYVRTHGAVAGLLGQPRMAVWKGGGGEAQRNPLKTCRVTWRRGETAGECEWPPLAPELAFDWRSEERSAERVAALWRGDIDEPAAEAAVVATAAVALWASGRCETAAAAEAHAGHLWQSRRTRQPRLSEELPSETPPTRPARRADT